MLRTRLAIRGKPALDLSDKSERSSTRFYPLLRIVQGHSKGGGGRLPMERRTADPASTGVPASGFWRSTVPMLLHVGSTTLVTCPTVRLAAAST